MKSNIISLIVTFGGLGNIKYFPGTIGSLAGLFFGIFIIYSFRHFVMRLQ